MVFDKIFNVLKETDKYIFLYCDISKKNELFEQYFEYFFDENVMFNYFNYLFNTPFKPKRENFNHLFYELKKLIDDYNIQTNGIVPKDKISGIESTLLEEGKIDLVDGDFKYRSDKAGKIGEYMFSILLERFFGLHCIIPKSRLTTDYNMNVYGIDVLYLNEEDNSLFFGESKFTKNIINGIAQINKSLESYEKQISDEYELVLNSWDSRTTIYKLHELFGESMSCSISFKDFIDKTEIKDVYIPLFIAHGSEIVSDKIFEKLDQINNCKIFDLNTRYVFISLPIVDKDEFMEDLTKRIDMRMREYAND